MISCRSRAYSSDYAAKALEVSAPAPASFLLVGVASCRQDDPPMTVLIYLDTSKQVGDPDHLKVFANTDAAEARFAENDAEGVALEYEVIGSPAKPASPFG